MVGHVVAVEGSVPETLAEDFTVGEARKLGPFTTLGVIGRELNRVATVTAYQLDAGRFIGIDLEVLDDVCCTAAPVSTGDTATKSKKFHVLTFLVITTTEQRGYQEPKLRDDDRDTAGK